MWSYLEIQSAEIIESIFFFLGGGGNREVWRVSESWSVKSETFWWYLSCLMKINGKKKMISGFQIGIDSYSHSREHQVTSWGKVTHSSMRNLVLSISLYLICGRCGISLSFPLCWVYMQSPSGFGLFCQVLLSLKFSLKYFRSGFLPVKTGKDNMDFNNLFFFF